MSDEKRDEEVAELAVSDSRSLAARSDSLVKRGLQSLTDRRQKRILKVDDEEALIEVTAKVLEEEGYEVKSTLHPSEAVALVSEFQPHIVLIDLVMPGIDGIELSKRLSEQFPGLKIVLTGVWIADHVIEDEIQRLLGMGVLCDTFEAPFERQDLISTASDWVRGLYHFDRATGLRDGKQFNMHVGGLAVFHESAACVFIELLQSHPPQMVEEIHGPLAAFLPRLGGTLRGFAGHGLWRGRAYRRELNKFAVLLPRVGKQEACAKSTELTKDIEWLLNFHKLDDRFSVAIDLVAISAAASDGQNL